MRFACTAAHGTSVGTARPNRVASVALLLCAQGQATFSHTFCTISKPVGTCQHTHNGHHFIALLLADTSCNCEEAHIRVQGRSLRHTYILSKACIHLICVTARDTKNASSGHGKEAHLPCKQQKIQRVEGDVGCARSLIALRHGRHQGGCSGPQHYDGSSSIQVEDRGTASLQAVINSDVDGCSAPLQMTHHMTATTFLALGHVQHGCVWMQDSMAI